MKIPIETRKRIVELDRQGFGRGQIQIEANATEKMVRYVLGPIKYDETRALEGARRYLNGESARSLAKEYCVNHNTILKWVYRLTGKPKKPPEYFESLLFTAAITKSSELRDRVLREYREAI